LVTGLSIGLLVALLVYLRGRVPTPVQPAAAPSPRAEQQAASSPKPQFEFYTILPEREVRVADHELRSSKKPHQPAIARPPAAVESPSNSTSYVLQVGSFRKHEEADRLKASLALLGLEAEIQTVRAARGENWHRVRLGPFTDRRVLQKTREQLRRNQLDALVMRNRG
jgi:cell division protein FtsN